MSNENLNEVDLAEALEEVLANLAPEHSDASMESPVETALRSVSW